MDPYEYFPGDPPLAETLAMLGFCIAVLTILVSLIRAVVRARAGRWTDRDRSRAIARVVGALLLACVSAAPIVSRHFGALGRLRDRLVELRSEFEQFRKDHPNVDDRALIKGFRAERGQLLVFRLTPEHRPIQIRLIRASPAPRFRVDFGKGGNADFDPDTMWVLYSD